MSTTYRRFTVALLAGSLLAGGATAQQREEPATTPDVIVTGVRDQEDAVRDFVGALTAASTDRQLSRFDAREACPAAMGLPPPQKGAVVARMRRIAQAAGVPLAGPKCKPNVLVIVARDKKALLQTLAKQSGVYFPGLGRDAIRRMVDDPAPAAAWQLAGPLLNADGTEMPQEDVTGMAVNRTTVNGSRIAMGSRPQFAAAAVVIDADALVGLTTTQLADYAAMRTFARTDPSRLAGSAAPTILTVLDAPMDSAVPVTMTQWDLGLLRGLYASSANLPAAAQRSEIARRVGGTVAADRKERERDAAD